MCMCVCGGVHLGTHACFMPLDLDILFVKKVFPIVN